MCSAVAAFRKKRNRAAKYEDVERSIAARRYPRYLRLVKGKVYVNDVIRHVLMCYAILHGY